MIYCQFYLAPDKHLSGNQRPCSARATLANIGELKEASTYSSHDTNELTVANGGQGLWSARTVLHLSIYWVLTALASSDLCAMKP